MNKFSVCFLLLLSSTISQAVTFDWAMVGNPGNADDIHGDGYGGVNQIYQISKTEVTNGQYIDFLNAVATVGDTYSLYNINMSTTFGGIDRIGAGTLGDPYAYSAKGGDANWLNRPVNYVSWGDSARFINWLHNGQPSGSQDTTTTENGAYFLNGANNNAALVAITRESNARFWIPTENEWYKAAYFDPNAGVYYDYAIGSDTAPGYVDNSGNLSGTATPFIDGVADPGGYATYRGDNGPEGIGSPYFTTEVGEWENSTSPYGTYDQSGNLWEWNETLFRSSLRGFRGGSFRDLDGGLQAVFRNGTNPTNEFNDVGFRVATVAIPEPCTLLLGTLAAVGITLRRRV